ncbi:MAG: clostripain-related cysteine peptidase [Phycisphaerales bacterium]
MPPTTFLAAALLLALAAPALAQDVAAATRAAAPQKKPWTILVYGAADNNADGPILGFLDGVRKAIDDDPGLDLLLFIDRHEKYSTDAKVLGEDFTGCRLYRLKKESAERLAGGSHMPQLTTYSETELDSADATTLGRFIAWGKEQSPAKRYCLLIYSHADGRTMCPDEQSGRHMGIAEATHEIGAGGHVDFLALELCNMGGIEIAYQWRPPSDSTAPHKGLTADVLLAIPNAGPPLDWHRAFARIRSDGHLSNAQQPPLDPAIMTAADFGALVIEEGELGRKAAAGRGRNVSHEAAAAYDLREAAAVKEAVDALAAALSAAGPAAKDTFLGLRTAGGPLMTYGNGGAAVDLYQLCQRAAECGALDTPSRDAARAAMERIDRFILASFGMGAYAGFEPGKHGVFIALPKPGQWAGFKGWYTPGPGSGDDYGRWAFLNDGRAGEGARTWYLLLKSWMDTPR